MKTIIIRFYGKLAEISRYKECIYEFWGKRAIIDILESLGVPKTEIFLVMFNQRLASLYEYPEHGDRISVYPKFMQFYLEIIKSILEDPYTSREIKQQLICKFWQYKIHKFVADVHLGKLTKYLRFLGVDVLYNPLWDDEKLIHISNEERRVLLTRDKGILKQKKLMYGFFLLNMDPLFQLLEILEYFSFRITPFTRCSLCNSLLEKKPQVEIDGFIHRIPFKVKHIFKEFYYCKQCNKFYWEGSHYDNMIKFFAKNNLML